MMRLQQITLRMGARILLENINLDIYPNQKIGLVGANGCGKTSLFRLILDQLQADDGQIFRENNCRIGHLAQEIPALTQSAMDYVCQGDDLWFALQQKIEQAEKNGKHEELAESYAKMHDIDGYTLQARAAELLRGLGFSHAETLKSVAEFSGGWRMRLNLARVLISRSDLLLLDEPTNHLDLEAILWLEKWLAKYPAAILLISHDRDFLDGVVTQIAHIEQKNLKMYKGDYSTFEQIRAEQIALQQAAFQKQQSKVQHAMKFVDRFRFKASKAKQAQSRLKMIERMQTVSDFHEGASFRFQFRNSDNKFNPMLVVEEGAIEYYNKLILANINLSIQTGSRIGILGFNGAGKTTFLKMLTGRLPLTSGVYQPAPQLKIGYFAQHQIDALVLHESPLQHLKRIDAQASEQTLRNFLGRFDFVGDQAFSAITTFSGGEKARLAFCLLAWQKPDLLLLDEPTNHLDMEMREALMMALQEYQGSMILISHDRYLLRACVDEFLLVANQRITSFDGDLQDYRDWCLAEKSESTTKKGAAQCSPIKNDYLANKERKKQQARLRTLDNTLEKLIIRERVLLEKLADDQLYEESNKLQLQQMTDEKKKIEADKVLLQEEWLTLSELLEDA
jgi:ATP-binding cassette subfamily F protein 3